jgi:hypothetical protein
MQELFHRWFHNPEKRGRYSGVNFSFEGVFFYSYHTAIGIKVTGRDKKPVLLIADNNMSPTTGRHIRQLIAACPYGAERVIEVPLVYGGRRPTIKDIAARFSSFFLEYDGARLSQVGNRRQVRKKAAAARQYSALVGKLPKKVMKALDALDHDAAAIDAKKAGARAERQRADAERQRADAERFRDKCASILATIPDMTYLDKIRSIFERDSELTPDQKRALLWTIAGPGVSLVWPDGDIIRTSQGITMPAPMVAALVDRWQAGTLPVGSHVGPYTLAEVTPEYIRVGCHKIPIENIKALAAELTRPAE